MDVWRPSGLTPAEAGPPEAGCLGPCPGSLFDDLQEGGSTASLGSLWQCLVRSLFFFSPGCFLRGTVGTVPGKSSGWVVLEPQWETFAKMLSWPFERFLDWCIHAWLSTFRIQQQYPLDRIFHGFCLNSLGLLRCVNVTQLYIYWQDLRHDVQFNYKEVKVGWNSGCCCKVCLSY